MVVTLLPSSTPLYCGAISLPTPSYPLFAKLVHDIMSKLSCYTCYKKFHDCSPFISILFRLGLPDLCVHGLSTWELNAMPIRKTGASHLPFCSWSGVPPYIYHVCQTSGVQARSVFHPRYMHGLVCFTIWFFRHLIRPLRRSCKSWRRKACKARSPDIHPGVTFFPSVQERKAFR